ncbi:MAG: GH116 family glycosyl-hydrolase, partial [Bacteroidales bacterium]|nr:GH116 family glycosyl-hydrolase [Bacteroidales bacterium]
RPAKGYSTVVDGNDAPFFAIYYSQEDGKSGTKALMGPIDFGNYEHMEGRSVNHHGLPRFREASFDAAYPFARVFLSDEDVPLNITLKAFNPLIPGDADKSGIPIAVLTYEVHNASDQEVDVSICGSLRNFIGRDGGETWRSWKGEDHPLGAKNNKNKFIKDSLLSGILMYSEDVDRDSPAWGTFAISTCDTNISYRTASKANYWSNSILDFWDDFSDDGILEEKEVFPDEDDPMASLSVSKKIEAGQKEEFNFYLTWHFPNRKAWSKEIVGNYYTTKYRDAWNVASESVPEMESLYKRSYNFVNSFIRSDLPLVVKEAALFNLSTLRSQTVFRIASGQMMGWEGCMDSEGSCFGSCTHVWNYEQSTPFLFGELAKTMRDVEFGYATAENGRMSFRASLPLSIASTNSGIAADGQMGTIMKFYREWQMSGDDKFLIKYWDEVKSVLEFAWVEGGWDANRDGVMEGSQHNTMDVNYFGPNPQMQFWYLGALRAASEMAAYLGENEFAVLCNKLYKKGRAFTDKKLFNGEYYEQIIIPPEGMTADDLEFQLGPGCLVDQLVGQYMSHISGLGYLADQENLATCLESIMEYNFKEDFNDHFNPMRSYALGDESGLLMASWPKGRLKVPFPYYAETMTGFEYTAATGMIYEGMEYEGLKVIESIRDRYDGLKRNPFDEAECGHHYARAMAAWAPVVAITGFNYSGVYDSFAFNSIEGKWFWSNGYAWGIIEIENLESGGYDIILKVIEGEITIKKFILNGVGKVGFEDSLVMKSGDKHSFYIKK